MVKWGLWRPLRGSKGPSQEGERGIHDRGWLLSPSCLRSGNQEGALLLSGVFACCGGPRRQPEHSSLCLSEVAVTCSNVPRMLGLPSFTDGGPGLSEMDLHKVVAVP